MSAKPGEVVSRLASPASVLGSPLSAPMCPASGIARPVTILGHAGLVSPLTGPASYDGR